MTTQQQTRMPYAVKAVLERMSKTDWQFHFILTFDIFAIIWCERRLYQSLLKCDDLDGLYEPWAEIYMVYVLCGVCVKCVTLMKIFRVQTIWRRRRTKEITKIKWKSNTKIETMLATIKYKWRRRNRKKNKRRKKSEINRPNNNETLSKIGWWKVCVCVCVCVKY